MTTAVTDFSELVRDLRPAMHGPGAMSDQLETHGTTVISLRFNGGVLTLADRRATAGNLIMYDRAEKIMALDDSTVAAISGAFAKSVEICRFLKHNLKYYRRVNLVEMSPEGKLAEISRALAGNAPMAMQGIGLFLPIVAAYDKKKDEFGVYFFDGAGARFENGSYACAGSGSERIRGVFEYIARKNGKFETQSFEQVLEAGVELLDIAAELDSATGGFDRLLPITRVLDREGNRPVEASVLRAAADKVLARR